LDNHGFLLNCHGITHRSSYLDLEFHLQGRDWPSADPHRGVVPGAKPNAPLLDFAHLLLATCNADGGSPVLVDVGTAARAAVNSSIRDS
jgi:hypothetical protein